MFLLIACLCVMVSLFVNVLSYCYINQKSTECKSFENNSEMLKGNDETTEKMKKSYIDSIAIILCQIKKKDARRWCLMIGTALITGISCYCMLGYELHTIAIMKMIITMEILLSAMIIDGQTKRIPNLLIGILLILRVILLIPEFIFQRQEFHLLVITSLIGLIGGFIIFYFLSVLTKGGFGMGDVKLIAAIGSMIGIAGIFYMVLYGMLVCMMTAIVLLITRKKGLKDQLPFGPFLFIGYMIAIMMGTF